MIRERSLCWEGRYMFIERIFLSYLGIEISRIIKYFWTAMRENLAFLSIREATLGNDLMCLDFWWLWVFVECLGVLGLGEGF